MKKILLAIVSVIVSVSVNAQVIKVYKNGSTTPEATYTNTTTDKYKVVFEEAPAAPATHAYVDLGLPSGTLWATCNVGADSPEDYGLYFAWGEITGYTSDTSDGRSFDWSTYKWCNGSDESMTKYCTVDNLTELEAADDAATANWGSDWCMPTKTQLEELINSSYTTTTWTTQNGVYGRLITSKMTGYTDKSIFLPAAGYRNDSSLLNAGSSGYYWSSGLFSTSNSSIAWELFFYSSNVYTNIFNRCCGLSVRPVRVSE